MYSARRSSDGNCDDQGTADAKFVLDNWVSAIIAGLPIKIDEPVERLIAVHEQIARHRFRREPEAKKSLLSLTTRAPTVFTAALVRIVAWFPRAGAARWGPTFPGRSVG
ncbi:WS/DGAT domain-containing protein [Nocardia sp. CA-119907]|uniref:WS/DGAT domain-containing protein n=1 Tax=Nocardia sp. CA-119907 TaxID=3239973 RepID=UPI003D987615